MSIFAVPSTDHRSKGLVALTIFTPIAFNIAYFHLAAKFRYPEILRDKPKAILDLFGQVETEIKWSWLLITLAAVAFIFVSTWVSNLLVETKSRTYASLAGGAAGMVQAIGLSRWLFAVPALHELSERAETAAAAETAFVLVHRSLGMGVGEFLGFLLTGIWTLLVARSIWAQGGRTMGAVGAVCAITIIAGCIETLGADFLGPVNAIGYLVWSFWLISLGIIIPKGKLLASR